jgi:ribonuclease Z
MIGPKGLEKVVNSLRIIAPELPFDINFIELSGPSEEIRINGYVIRAFRVNHNVTCYGYNVIIERAGRFSPEKAQENNVPQKFWNRLQKGENIQDEDRILIPDMILGPPRKGIKLTYCTDTRPVPAIVESAMNSDLFICEGMYGEKDKDDKAIDHKHMTFYEAANLAKNAEVSELWLTHYSPSLVRPEDYLNDTRAIFNNTKAGKDGKSVTLQFDPKE